MERAERRKIQEESSKSLFSLTTTYAQVCSIFIPEHVLAKCLYMGISKKLHNRNARDINTRDLNKTTVYLNGGVYLVTSARKLKSRGTLMRARILSGGFLHLIKTSRDLCLTVARANAGKYMYCLQFLSLC